MNHYSFGLCKNLEPETHSFIFVRKGEVISEEFTSDLFKEMMCYLSELDENYIAVLLQSNTEDVIMREMEEERTGQPATVNFESPDAPKILMKIKRHGPKVEFHPSSDWNNSFLEIASAVGIGPDLTSEPGSDDW